MASRYPVCWQDTRLVFGSLNNVYQELSQYESIVDLWDAIPEEEDVIWLGQPNVSPMILQSDVNRPYGASCYTVEVKRDVINYPQQIRLIR